jgi:hypothetical protein
VTEKSSNNKDIEIQNIKLKCILGEGTKKKKRKKKK